MMKYKVTFKPDNKTIEADKGENLLSCAVRAGIYLTSSCGGDGVCGRCRVIIEKGSYRQEHTGSLTPEDLKKGYALACVTDIEGDLVVRIPPSSRLDMKTIETDVEDLEKIKAPAPEEEFTLSPLVTKLYLELPPPTLGDTLSDLERVYRQILKKHPASVVQTGLANIRRLGPVLRESDWKVTVLLGDRNGATEVISLEPGDTSGRNYGVAFDIGTTTVAGELVDLKTKKIIASKAAYNKQAVFGDDVITRIIYASENGGLDKLHSAVTDNMNEIINELVKDGKASLSDINAVACAGNTTMIHLLLNVDPKFIRMEPYVPTANFTPTMRASEAGININPRGLLACVPGVSSYVGGDAVAGTLASGLSEKGELALFIDIGTNGEIVLGSREWLISAAASAGPAFEGSGLACGMRAMRGAIERVRILDAENVSFETIGGVPARGICGSGYIDLLAGLFAGRIMDRDGKLSSSVKSGRIRRGEDGFEFVLAFKKESGGERDIVLRESDIENLKRSKAAIYSASSAVLKKLNLGFEDVRRFYIAGGFGTSIDIEKAITIGLLPDIERSRFVFLGNSSLTGARETLLSREAFRKAEALARKMSYLELSAEAGYMDEYIQALFFPHTDLARFKSVRTN